MVLRTSPMSMLSRVTASEAVKEDGLSKLLGGFGRWQLYVFVSVCLVKLSSGWVQMAIVFLTPKTVFYCVDSPNVTMEVSNGTCIAGCRQYAFDASPMETTIVTEWELVCERAWMASFTQTVLQLGILLGSILFGFLSDRHGRRVTFLCSVSALIVTGLTVPFAPDYWTFTGLRFLLGASCAGTMVVSFVIVVEAVGPQYREIFGCLFQIPFILGHMTVPLFAYYLRRWQSYTLALGVAPLVYVGYFFTLSESPRWLLSAGRVDDAAVIVTKAASMNQLKTENISESLTKLCLEMKSSSSIQPRPHYGALLSRELRVRTLVVCAIWLVAGLTFFGLNQYIGQTSPNPFISVAATGAIQIPANLASIWLVSRLGRRVTISLCFCLSGVSVITLGCLPDAFGVTLALGTLGVSFAAVVATAVYIYSSELFPTVVRNMAMGASSTSMRVGSMIAPFVANLGPTAPWLPTAVFGVTPLAASLLVLLLPETKGKALPDTIQDLRQPDTPTAVPAVDNLNIDRSMWRRRCCGGVAQWLSVAAMLLALAAMSAQAQLTFSSGWKRSGVGGGRGSGGGGGIELSMSPDDCRPDRALINIYDLIKNEAVRLLACQQK